MCHGIPYLFVPIFGIKNYTLFRLSPIILLGPHHGMARPQDAGREDSLQLWRVATIKLNKRLQTSDKEWASSLGVERGAYISL
jgi:hypothetical protein